MTDCYKETKVARSLVGQFDTAKASSISKKAVVESIMKRMQLLLAQDRKVSECAWRACRGVVQLSGPNPQNWSTIRPVYVAHKHVSSAVPMWLRRTQDPSHLRPDRGHTLTPIHPEPQVCVDYALHRCLRPCAAMCACRALQCAHKQQLPQTQPASQPIPYAQWRAARAAPSLVMHAPASLPVAHAGRACRARGGAR